jgi:ferric-dicitrate binding protein FerR (iron transport regulator)
VPNWQRESWRYENLLDEIVANGKKKFEVTGWNQGLFRAGRTPLNSFLKRLLWFDAAIIVLGGDEVAGRRLLFASPHRSVHASR